MQLAKDFFRTDLDPILLPDEWVLERLRNWRNAALAATDWTQVQDAPVNKQAWALLRQELRNLPASNLDAQAIIMPSAEALGLTVKDLYALGLGL